jgi:predicted GNAT superfamily acetyltransferase
MDTTAVLALGRESEAETSALDAESLAALVAEAFHVGLCDEGRAAFLIAFDETAGYASPNYQWFRERHARFVYVDRVVVAAAARGRGLARSLYRDLFAVARAADHDLVCCEVNVEPPNPVSDAFHAALGFTEVGQATLAGGGKRVRYLERRLAADDAP